MTEMLYDKDIREPLFDFLEESYGKVRIIEEKQMGRSRADVVMVAPGALYGIEIKSDADTYARLERQVRDYDRFYDYNIIVVGTTHAHHIKEHVPEWWGIITVELVEGVCDFYILRKPLKNEKRDLGSKLHILWRKELAHILEMNAMPKYEGLSKQKVAAKLLTAVAEEELDRQISEELFERDYTTIQEEIQAFRKKKRYRRSGRKASGKGDGYVGKRKNEQ